MRMYTYNMYTADHTFYYIMCKHTASCEHCIPTKPFTVTIAKTIDSDMHAFVHAVTYDYCGHVTMQPGTHVNITIPRCCMTL